MLGLFALGNGAGLAIAPATAVAMASIRPERSGMASGILSTQRGLGSTAGFAIMGTILALVVAAQLPEKLEPVIPNPVERSVVVDDIVKRRQPPGRSLGDRTGAVEPPDERADVIAAADSAFVDGIRLAELFGFALVAGTFVFGWVVFPRSERVERADELAEAAALDEAPGPT